MNAPIRIQQLAASGYSHSHPHSVERGPFIISAVIAEDYQVEPYPQF
ncbi:MAG: hypothetical protein IKZ19_08760 [Clostridia bacterium]|nr:hypothetical protein [Clostridia bacterium]